MSRETTIEFPDGPGKWLQYKTKYMLSKRGNFYAKLVRENSEKEEIYVWKDFRDGQPVYTLKNGKWVEAGRIVGYTVFIGSKDQLSYEEWLETPEGKAWMEEQWKAIREGRSKW